jgi:gluconokinase
MPPGLLESQFKTLEPPASSENPVTVSIDASVESIVNDIISQLGPGAVNSQAVSRNRT